MLSYIFKRIKVLDTSGFSVFRIEKGILKRMNGIGRMKERMEVDKKEVNS